MKQNQTHKRIQCLWGQENRRQYRRFMKDVDLTDK